MEYKMPGTCPICFGEMIVTSLQCKDCESTLSGGFKSCPFCRLSTEQTDFLFTFLKSRGSIKEVERELGISYPTVRNRLGAVLATLGLGGADVEREEVDHVDVISRLEAGEISPEGAVELLRGTQKRTKKRTPGPS